MKFKNKKYSSIKRILDFSISFIGLIILTPLLVVLVILIRVDSKGSPIFKQKRLGVNGVPFTMLKLRTMKLDSEKEGVYERKGDLRVTKIGKILRKTSLDEIPQLFNIMIGQMSFVGPRPILTYHPWTYDKYSDEQLIIFSVRPGITGWAQINGRKEVDWPERINMNIYYAQNYSFLLDFKIVLGTILTVFSMENNYNI